MTEKRHHNKNINTFIRELRKKYMGDIIDISLSNGRPVQLLPFLILQFLINSKFIKSTIFIHMKMR